MFVINIAAVISNLYIVTANKLPNSGIKKRWNNKVYRQCIYIYIQNSKDTMNSINTSQIT